MYFLWIIIFTLNSASLDKNFMDNVTCKMYIKMTIIVGCNSIPKYIMLGGVEDNLMSRAAVTNGVSGKIK